MYQVLGQVGPNNSTNTYVNSTNTYVLGQVGANTYVLGIRLGRT